MRALYFDCSAELKALYDSADGMADILSSLEFRMGDPDPSELPDLLAGYAGVLNGHTRMTANVLAACPDLKVIVFLGTEGVWEASGTYSARASSMGRQRPR